MQQVGESNTTRCDSMSFKHVLLFVSLAANFIVLVKTQPSPSCYTFGGSREMCCPNFNWVQELVSQDACAKLCCEADGCTAFNWCPESEAAGQTNCWLTTSSDPSQFCSGDCPTWAQTALWLLIPVRHSSSTPSPEENNPNNNGNKDVIWIVAACVTSVVGVAVIVFLVIRHRKKQRHLVRELTLQTDLDTNVDYQKM